MKILLISGTFGKVIVKDCAAVPRVGDRVDVFYEPLPTVTGVVWWPSTERLNELGDTLGIDVIVTVE